jgi:hypothetical protein
MAPLDYFKGTWPGSEFCLMTAKNALAYPSQTGRLAVSVISIRNGGKRALPFLLEPAQANHSRLWRTS